MASIEELLVHPEAKIVDVATAGDGNSGSRILTLEAPDDDALRRFRVKWRALSTTSRANSPRKEVVSYFVQRLFLEPQDYVYPPTRSRCFELEHYRDVVDPTAEPSFPEQSPCVLGTVSYWLDRGKPFADSWWRRERVFSREAFQSDPVYRRTAADVNLLAVLTLNGDTHSGNFVRVPTRSSGGQRLYLVDGSMSFTPVRNVAIRPEDDFSTLIVPALREQSIARLIGLDTDDLDALFAVERLVPKGEQLVSETVTSDRGITPSPEGLRWQKCLPDQNCELQLMVGMTPWEKMLLENELWHLKSRISMRQVPTFIDEEGEE